MKPVAPFSLLLLATTIASCDELVVFEENSAIEKATWNASDVKSFEFNIDDTVTMHDIFVNLRNGENYPYSNIFFFIELQFPNGKKSLDTLECKLADETGRWYGTSGIGDIYENRFLYYGKRQFPITGRYRIDINQAMRSPELAGIYDVGVRVARSE